MQAAGSHSAGAGGELNAGKPRAIALIAAKAWGLAAKAADARDAKQTPLDTLDAEIALEFLEEDAEIAAAGEVPKPKGAG